MVLDAASTRYTPAMALLLAVKSFRAMFVAPFSQMPFDARYYLRDLDNREEDRRMTAKGLPSVILSVSEGSTRSDGLGSDLSTPRI